MKTAAKVFIWMGMILGCYLVYPIIIGVLALKKLDHNADKNEVHNFGVITLLFCSFLGGLFMLLIDENESYNMSINSTVVKYETIKLTKEEQRELNGGKVGKVSYWLIFTIGILSILSVIFGLSIISLLDNDYVYIDDVLSAMLPAILQIIFSAIPVVIYFYNNQWVSKGCNIALICCIPLYAMVFIFAVYATVVRFETAHILLLLIILIAFALFMLSIITVVLNRKVLYTKRKNKVVTNALEYKLDEIEKLLENKIITQSEHEKMREKIISEYSN